MEIEDQQLYINNYGFSTGGWQYWSGSPIVSNDICFHNQVQFHAPQQKQNGQAVSPFHDMAVQMEEQKREVDRLMSYQTERWRLFVQEQKRQQTKSILRNYEAKIEIVMKQKEQEIAEALNKNMELEDFLSRMEIECQKWQQVATENETLVESLTNTIDQYKKTTYFTNQVEDSESCCDSQANAVEKGRENVCKFCNIQERRVVFLPCRHFCCCKSCEGFFDTCPICGIVKKGSIEAILSKIISCKYCK